MKKSNKNTNKKYKAQTSLFFGVWCAVVILILIILVLLCHFNLEKENYISILTSVTKDYISAVLISFIVGAFFKMITEKFFIVKKNDKLLRKFGVLEVGTGVSTRKDVHSIFGYEILNIYPQEIHLLYITGNVYLSVFRKELTKCLKHGCVVKLLLVSTDEKNIDFVHRLEEIYERNNGKFGKQIDDVKALISELKTEYTNQIRIRFYQDEYFYNFRSAKYYDSKTDTVFYKSNINIQPFNKPAADCSIGLSGTYKSSDKDLDNNIFYLNDKAFDKLWDKYEETEY